MGPFELAPADSSFLATRETDVETFHCVQSSAGHLPKFEPFLARIDWRQSETENDCRPGFDKRSHLKSGQSLSCGDLASSKTREIQYALAAPEEGAPKPWGGTWSDRLGCWFVIARRRESREKSSRRFCCLHPGKRAHPLRRG